MENKELVRVCDFCVFLYNITISLLLKENTTSKKKKKYVHIIMCYCINKGTQQLKRAIKLDYNRMIIV